jgi:hypothetical protein
VRLPLGNPPLRPKRWAQQYGLCRTLRVPQQLSRAGRCANGAPPAHLFSASSLLLRATSLLRAAACRLTPLLRAAAQTAKGRGPRLGSGARDKGAPVYQQAVKRELSGDADVVTGDAPEDEVDPKDAIIAELQRQVAELQEQLKAKAQGEGDQGEEDDLARDEDDGNEADELPDEDLDPDSPEAQAKREAAEYAERLADMELAELVAHLEGERGQDLSACMAMSAEEAETQCADLLRAKTVKELCELALKRNLAIADCLSVDRDQLLKLAGDALGVDPDGLDHNTDAQLIEQLVTMEVDPAEYYDKDKLIAKLTKGAGMKVLRELMVNEFGMDLSELMDQDKLIELAESLGPPKEAADADSQAAGDEEGVDEEGVDEATKPKPKPGDPDWVPSKKPVETNDAVKALEKLREDARPDWFPGGMVDGSWNPPSGNEYWKWRQSSDGKRWSLQLRQAHFNKYASTQSLPGPGPGSGTLRPNADPQKAVSTMTRSQMNARFTLAKKLEVTDKFRRNPLLKPKKTPKAGWLYKWREDAQTWRKRWCQVEKVDSGGGPEYLLTYRAGKGKRELGSYRLLDGQLRHHGVIAQKEGGGGPAPLSQDEEEGTPGEPEPESELEPESEDEAESELESGTASSQRDDGTQSVSVSRSGSGSGGGSSVKPEVSVETIRSRMLRKCNNIEEEARQETLRLQQAINSLKLKTMTTSTRKVIAKHEKELLRREMQLNTILASKEGASICMVVVEASGKSGLFRTDQPGTKGRVDIHSWYLALKPLLVPQGSEVQESAAEALATGSYKYLLPDPSKKGRASRGSFAFEYGGQQEDEASGGVGEEEEGPDAAELAVQQSEGKAVVLSGHPNAICNGEYHPVAELHDGWPRYESLAGTSAGASMHIFRSVELKKWFLSRRFVPDSELNNANILADEGPIPTGTNTWRCFIKGEWVDQVLQLNMVSRQILEARVAVAKATEEGDSDAIKAAKDELDRLVAEEEEGDSDDEGSVATTGLISKGNAPGIGTPQSVFAVRARTRSLVLPDQAKFEPWRNGMRRKRIEQRKELLIASTAKEWIPNGFKKSGQCGHEPKVESITTGFLYPAENEKPDMP